MANAPQLKEVIPSLSYSSSQWDDPNDTWDSSGTWDGATAVQSGFSDRVLVDVLSSVLIFFLPVLTLVKRIF